MADDQEDSPPPAKNLPLFSPSRDGLPARIAEFDYRQGVPEWVQRMIEERLALEEEDAKRAGAIGYMARALVQATMPYKDPKADVFRRVNGNFTLRIVAGYDGGLPYGIYPRLLMNWLTTVAVQQQSRVIELGEGLGDFMKTVLDVPTMTGGRNGSGTRVTEQMKRLFGSVVSASYREKVGRHEKGFALQNVLIADSLYLDDKDTLWLPQQRTEAGQWKSKVILNEAFYREIIAQPVTIDIRKYKSLRGSPMAMDIYCWLTYRYSYLSKRTWPIEWPVLATQFGSTFTAADPKQAMRDFKKAFINALKIVSIAYDKANFDVTDKGLILRPSPTDVPKLSGPNGQRDLL